METYSPTNARELKEFLRLRAQRNPLGRLVQCRDTILSNAGAWQLLETARAQFGPIAGKRALLLLPESAEAYLLYLLWFLEGGVLIPLPLQTVTERIKHVCERVSPDVILINDSLLRAHMSALSTYRPAIIQPVPRLPSQQANYRAFRDFTGIPFFSDRSASAGDPVRQIIFTSGSTGSPKGVCLGERSILSAAWMMVQFLPLETSTSSMVTVPLYDYYGMIQIFGHIIGGGSYAFGYQTGLADQFLRTMHDLSCSDLVLVPFTLRNLLGADEKAKHIGFRNLRRITSSSDTLTADLLCGVFDKNSEIVIVNIYGLTEIGRAFYRKITRSTPPDRSVGTPSPGVGVFVDGNQEAPGPIVLRGPNLMLGYQTGISNSGVTYSPCFEMKTGDLGYIDSGGELHLIGRQDHLFNLMGMKVHPDEIESQVLRLPGITDARASLRQTEAGGKSVFLEVVRADTSVSEETILFHLRQVLPRPFLPRSVSFVSSLPCTSIGAKMLRH